MKGQAVNFSFTSLIIDSCYGNYIFIVFNIVVAIVDIANVFISQFIIKIYLISLSLKK